VRPPGTAKRKQFARMDLQNAAGCSIMFFLQLADAPPWGLLGSRVRATQEKRPTLQNKSGGN
jgi:hypothetical protein